jgi:N-acetylmuramoyl-L-alanine amidase
MAKTRTGKASSAKGKGSNRRDRQLRLQRWLLAGVFAMLGILIAFSWAVTAGTSQTGDGFAVQPLSWLEDIQAQPHRMIVADGQRVGIIAGHMDSDTGALCPNGLTEADTVREIAERVVRRLRGAGAAAELLAEYDERLDGYRGDVVVSIHADACIERSGYKVARSEASAIPEIDDRLVACLTEHYAATTGLTFDSYTVTEDMIGYHVFQRVADETPAAIIETGFLGGDRTLLTQRPSQVARGIADGVICFLEDGGEGT